MSDTMTLQRLRHTPMRDLLRGRVTGRLDWRGRITAAGLPAPASELIHRVVKQTKLWRGERAEVADELVAHFADGLASGASVEEIVRSFGDEAAAAKLIRRAKRRNRPLGWHAFKYAVRGFAVLCAIYGVLVVRFMMGSASVKVDYLARMNAPVERIPAVDRAWPLYRQ